MKSLQTITVACILATGLSFGQTQQQTNVGNRTGSTTRDLPSPAKESVTGNTGDSASVTSSDTGAQRPLLLKKSGFSGSFGYSSKIAYEENPLGAPGVLDQQADAVWKNSFQGQAKLGVYDLGNSVLTPFVGGAWTMTDFTYKNDDDIISDLSTLNFNSTTAYLLFLLQHESGWAFRAGVMYANDRSTENDTEDYMEFYPSVGVTKAYSHTDAILGVFDASLGVHKGDIEELGSGHTSDELDHFDVTGSYSLIYSFDNFSLMPSYSVSFRDYSKGFNKDREDILHSISLNLDYPISESFELSVFSDYSKRESSGENETLYEFKKFSIGTGLSLIASF